VDPGVTRERGRRLSKRGLFPVKPGKCEGEGSSGDLQREQEVFSLKPDTLKKLSARGFDQKKKKKERKGLFY